jgi:hypothetical protein
MGLLLDVSHFLFHASNILGSSNPHVQLIFYPILKLPKPDTPVWQMDSPVFPALPNLVIKT